MASRFYGVDVGAMRPADVTEGSSTGSKAVELQIDLAKCTDKLQALNCLEAIANYLRTTEGNPIG